MPDEPLDPQTDERVRRLLAEARHDAPMPDEVVDRMDAVLAELAAEPDTRRRVVRLADRRRRAASLLVAAAVVVVAGVGVSEVFLQRDGLSSLSSGDAGAGAAREPKAARGHHQDAPTANEVQGYSATDSIRAPLPVRPRHFYDDVRRARKQTVLASSMDGTLEMDSRANDQFGVVPLGECREPGWGRGRYVPVRYGSSPGYLVFRSPAGDTQVADLFLCGVADAVRSITLPRS